MLSGATKMAGVPGLVGASKSTVTRGGSLFALSSLIGRRPASGVDVETGLGLFMTSPIVAG
jgi:hypothetical protein